MKKTILIILVVGSIIGTLYYGLRTNNAPTINGKGPAGETPLVTNPLVTKIEQKNKNLTKMITTKNVKQFKNLLKGYNSVLLRAKSIAKERPFPFTKDPANIIKTLDYILFNGFHCNDGHAESIDDENEKLNIIIAKIEPSIKGMKDAVCSSKLKFMKLYLDEYQSMLEHAKEVVQELEKPIIPGQPPADIIEVLDFII